MMMLAPPLHIQAMPGLVKPCWWLPCTPERWPVARQPAFWAAVLMAGGRYQLQPVISV
jgi:hypothetical protein